MAGIFRPIFLLGAAVALTACAGGKAPPLLPHETAQAGSHTVRKVQVALRERGYYAGVVDGFLGQDTGYGIQRFQVDHCQRVKPVVNRPLLVSLGIVSEVDQ